jgi:hypothetical protein
MCAGASSAQLQACAGSGRGCCRLRTRPSSCPTRRAWGSRPGGPWRQVGGVEARREQRVWLLGLLGGISGRFNNVGGGHGGLRYGGRWREGLTFGAGLRKHAQRRHAALVGPKASRSMRWPVAGSLQRQPAVGAAHQFKRGFTAQAAHALALARQARAARRAGNRLSPCTCATCWPLRASMTSTPPSLRVAELQAARQRRGGVRSAHLGARQAHCRDAGQQPPAPARPWP